MVPSGIHYLAVGAGSLWPCRRLPDLWAASPAPRPRLPDFRVASFWRCSARVVALHLYPLTFALGLCLNHEGEGDPSGCLPEISSSSGLVKVWEFRRRFGVRAVGPFLPFQSSESWARTHRAPAQALGRSGSSRYSPPALPWAPPPSDLNLPFTRVSELPSRCISGALSQVHD